MSYGSPALTTPLVVWRIDHEKFASDCASGHGAFIVGGRWNPKGYATVYSSIDAATTILESAVHKGFHVLDTVPHVLTAFEIADPIDVYVVKNAAVPNPNWLHPGVISPGQQQYGKAVMESYAFVALPSVVSKNSWNVIFNPTKAAGKFKQVHQERFSLDTRLV